MPDRVHHRQSTINARNLRHNQTDAEQVMWHHLKARRFMNLKFRRQHPVGPFIADFACLEARLIVEIDGGQHSENARDASRNAYMNKEGFEVVRFWNNDVLQNIDGVLSALSLTLSRFTGEGTEQEACDGPQ